MDNIKVNVTITLPGRVFKVEKDRHNNIRIKDTHAMQSINLTKEAYDYMTSKEKPAWYRSKDWYRLSKNARLNIHLARTCEYFDGIGFEFHVFED